MKAQSQLFGVEPLFFPQRYDFKSPQIEYFLVPQVKYKVPQISQIYTDLIFCSSRKNLCKSVKSVGLKK